MPDIKPDLRAIFCEALDQKTPKQLSQCLDAACAGDLEMRSRIDDLLRAHRDAGQFMEGTSATTDATPSDRISERLGTLIGRYKLLEQIGEGGMGVVYVAEQREPVKRKVALKIIKLGMDTEEVISRFKAERQALALMDHPNIAQVFDGGATESGRPYFVMELVRGIPITEYCDQNDLTARERLELLLSVCLAVQHAHQKGVIHRDVKPTNVLVTLHDGKPVPKIIDFGVAKAINQKLTERTVYTGHLQMIGTPLYMSPEQADLSGLDVDTRTDIYSLGVLLYELLTGTTPFDKERLHQAAYDEVCRIIRNEEPPKPSARITTLGATATAISAHRKTDPRRLSQIIRGDLDWIVMKALEKDRTRRYETASALAADVQRQLKNEPVEARAPSPLYRLQKFVRRNRVAVATAVLVAMTLALGAGGITWERHKASMNRLNLQARDSIRQARFSDAEKILEVLRLRGFAAAAETLKTRHELGLKYAENGQLEKAAKELQETQHLQRLVLGGEHKDSRLTDTSVENLAQRCLAQGWELMFPRADQEANYQRGARLATLALELNPSFSTMAVAAGVRGAVEYRRGNWDDSLHCLRKTVESDNAWPWPGTWFLLAMVHHQLGNEVLSRDWFRAACEWSTNVNSEEQVARLRDEAASQLGLKVDKSPTDYISFYSQMIEHQRRTGVLFYRRGVHFARRMDWKAAARDFSTAAELQPSYCRAREAFSAVCLHLRDIEGYEAVCVTTLTRLHKSENRFVNRFQRMTQVIDCSLGPSKNADPHDLDRIAAAILSLEPEQTYLRLGKGITAYRCGKYVEALATIPTGGFVAPAKDDVLALLFRAMAQQVLGRGQQARETLAKARREIERHGQGPDGPQFDAFDDRAVVWCLVQEILRQAEALIEPVNPNADGEERKS